MTLPSDFDYMTSAIGNAHQSGLTGEQVYAATLLANDAQHFDKIISLLIRVADRTGNVYGDLWVGDHEVETHTVTN